MEEGDKRDELVIAIAKHMKKAYMAWNRDEVEDDVIAAHLDELSEGRIDFSKVKLYIYRKRNDKPYGMSRPCPSCMAAIKDLGIKHIYYTTNEGFAYECITQEDLV